MHSLKERIAGEFVADGREHAVAGDDGRYGLRHRPVRSDTRRPLSLLTPIPYSGIGFDIIRPMRAKFGLDKLTRLEIASVKANLLPMAVLWGLAGAAVGAYYLMPDVAETMSVFARLQVEYGKLASFVNRFFLGGVVPGVFLLTMPSIRPSRPLATVFAQALWCGLMGVAVDAFFALQGVWFGTEPSLGTAVVKTLVDQFGFCVLFVTPLNALFYVWVGNGFSLCRDGHGLTCEWFWRSYTSNIAMNWVLTVPTLVAVYLFPMELQMTVSGFVCAIWALLAIFIGRSVA